MATPVRRNTEKNGQETQRDGNEILALYEVVREVKSPRKQGPPCSRPRKCFEQVSSDEREHLLIQFNYMGQYDLHCVTPTGIFTSSYRNQFVDENFLCDTIHSLFIYPASANDMPQII